MPRIPVLPAPLAGLMHPGAYPHAVASVQLLETPLSWILLAGDRVYKLKRPVRLPFVDQSLPAHRQHLCHEELRLNRRFAPDMYLEVCAVCAQEGQARIGGEGRPIEYAVVMRAFDRREQLDQLVLHKRLARAELEEFATWLAATHQQLPSQSGSFGPGQPEAVAAAMARNGAECAAASDIFGTTLRCRQLAERLTKEVCARAVALRWRAGAGCIRECHADLHLSNVVRLDGRLRPFDCLEFDPALRWIDAAQDIAFLHADLLGYHEPVLAAAFLDAYLRSSGDYHACLVMPLYTADRAMVRAKVLALQASALRDGGDRELLRRRHARYLDVAEQALQRRTARCVAPGNRGWRRASRRRSMPWSYARMWNASALTVWVRWIAAAVAPTPAFTVRSPRNRCTSASATARPRCWGAVSMSSSTPILASVPSDRLWPNFAVCSQSQSR
jgi:uncharacterized protein